MEDVASNEEMVSRELYDSQVEKAIRWEKTANEHYYNFRKALDFLRQGKRQFTPNTTNSLVDEFLEQFKDL